MNPDRLHLPSPLCVVLLLTCAGWDGATATNWPPFRGPDASGVSADAAPVTWNIADGLNLLWQTPLPGLGHASPLVWEPRIYVPTAVRPDASAGALCKDDAAATG